MDSPEDSPSHRCPYTHSRSKAHENSVKSPLNSLTKENACIQNAYKVADSPYNCVVIITAKEQDHINFVTIGCYLLADNIA